MKKIIALLVLAVSMLSLPAFAGQDVGVIMHKMAKSYRAVMDDKTLADIKVDLAKLDTEVKKAQNSVPDFLASKPATDPMRVAYREGINKLLKQIAIAQEYANEGNFNKAQEAAAKLSAIKHYYHHKLGV